MFFNLVYLLLGHDDLIHASPRVRPILYVIQDLLVLLLLLQCTVDVLVVDVLHADDGLPILLRWIIDGVVVEERRLGFTILVVREFLKLCVALLGINIISPHLVVRLECLLTTHHHAHLSALVLLSVGLTLLTLIALLALLLGLLDSGIYDDLVSGPWDLGD